MVDEQEKTKVFGDKEYHFYKTVFTRDQTELKQIWLRKRGYEFKVFTNSDNGFDIFTYPKVVGK